MMKRKKFGFIAIIALLCLTLFAFAACSKSAGDVDTTNPNVPGGPSVPGSPNVPDGPGGPTGGGALSAVDENSIRFTCTDTEFFAVWGAVTGAQSYVVTAEGKTYTVTDVIVYFNRYDDFVYPTSGEITISIVAKASGKTDSPATTKTYKTEGVVLRSPEITSVENGQVTWQAVPGASAYILLVNGAAVSNNNDGLYHGTSYDASALTGTVTVSVTAVGDGVWRKNSRTTSVVINMTSGTVSPAPVTDYTVTDGVLSWPATQGYTKYLVVDVDFNMIIVEDTKFDMSGSNVVYGVYPYNGSLDMEIIPVDIKYLDGKGTEAEPYLIKTPFDLRAVDYYETLYAEKGGNKNYYRIENDIDYNAVVALDDESNLYTLHKPFFGTLDGNNKKLSNISVNYDGGYWSLFDFIATGATVKNIVFDSPKITNKVQDSGHPLNAAISVVAYVNNGTISGITLKDATLTAQGGSVCGIVTRNYGTVSGCTVSGNFVQLSTADMGSAMYEMAGVVIENCSGGTVSGCTANSLSIRGANNIRSASGVVYVNRSGGTMRSNGFNTLSMVGVSASSELGGVVACNEGTVIKGEVNLGTLTVDGTPVTVELGGADGRGKLIGRNI